MTGGGRRWALEPVPDQMKGQENRNDLIDRERTTFTMRVTFGTSTTLDMMLNKVERRHIIIMNTTT